MPNPFDEAKQLLSSKLEAVENPYMVNRVLSFTPEACMQANDINRYVGRLPKWAITSLFNLVIPTNTKRQFFKYTKKKGVKERKLIEKIRRYFCVNEYHAKQIIEVLRRENIKPQQSFGLKEGE